jgi:hypothetical protein
MRLRAILWLALLVSILTFGQAACATQKAAKPSGLGTWKSTQYIGPKGERSKVPADKHQILGLRGGGQGTLDIPVGSNRRELRITWSQSAKNIKIFMDGKPFQNGTLSSDGKTLTTRTDVNADPMELGTVWAKQ